MYEENKSSEYKHSSHKLFLSHIIYKYNHKLFLKHIINKYNHKLLLSHHYLQI